MATRLHFENCVAIVRYILVVTMWYGVLTTLQTHYHRSVS